MAAARPPEALARHRPRSLPTLTARRILNPLHASTPRNQRYDPSSDFIGQCPPSRDDECQIWID